MFASSIIDPVWGSVLANFLLLLVGWLRFKSELSRKTAEIKTHTDVTVTKLNGVLRYLIHSMDRPCWLKMAYMENGKLVFRMLEVNHHYEAKYGISRQNYIGKTDLEAGWNRDIARRIYKNDLLVWSSGEPQTVIEKTNQGEAAFYKIRVQSDTGELKGIFGFEVFSDPDLQKQEGDAMLHTTIDPLANPASKDPNKRRRLQKMIPAGGCYPNVKFEWPLSLRTDRAEEKA